MSQGTLHTIDPTGDTRTMWDPRRKDEVRAARDQFDKMKAKGYLAYTVDADGEKGEVITKFDPKLGKIIMTPPLAGG